MMKPEDKRLVDIFMKAQAEPTGEMFSENVLRGLKAVLEDQRLYVTREQDAARYRWIRSAADQDWNALFRDGGDVMDAVIDAKMKEGS